MKQYIDYGDGFWKTETSDGRCSLHREERDISTPLAGDEWVRVISRCEIGFELLLSDYTYLLLRPDGTPMLGGKRLRLTRHLGFGVMLVTHMDGTKELVSAQGEVK